MGYIIFETKRDASSIFVEMQNLSIPELIQFQIKVYEGAICAKLDADAFYEPLSSFLDARPDAGKSIENMLYGFIRQQNYGVALPERHVKRALPVPLGKAAPASNPSPNPNPNPNPSPFPAPAAVVASPDLLQVVVDRKAIEREIQKSISGLVSPVVQKNLKLNANQCRLLMAAYNNPLKMILDLSVMGAAAPFLTGSNKTYFKKRSYQELIALVQNEVVSFPESSPSPSPAPVKVPAAPAPAVVKVAPAAAVPTRGDDLESLQNLIFPQPILNKKRKYVDPDAHVVNKSFVRNNRLLLLRIFMGDALFKQSFEQLSQNRENIRKEFSDFLKQEPRYQGDAHYKTAVDNIFGGYWTTDKESEETGGVSLQDMMLMIYALLKRRATLDHCPLTDTPAYGFLMLQLEDQSKTCFQGAIARMFSAFAIGMREFYERRGS